MGGMKPFKGVLVFLFSSPLVFLLPLFSSAMVVFMMVMVVMMVIYLFSKLW